MLHQEFARVLTEKQVDDERLQNRFLVFCFKYDLAALVLAAENQLASCLGVPAITPTWVKPVEDQNHQHPPKRIVERLFMDNGEKYQATIDAPLILGAAQYSDIVFLCPQCFQPFVNYLESLLGLEIGEAQPPDPTSTH